MKKYLLFIIGLFISALSFGQAPNNAYANNQIEIEPGVFAIYSGDIEPDGVLDIFDQIALDNASYDAVVNGTFGYLVTDLTGDAVVDIFDQIILDNNTTNLVYSHSPINP